jgi:hypothetical protein
MITYKLSAPTEEQIKSYLAELTQHEQWEQYASNLSIGIHNTYYIGRIVDVPAELNDEGEVVTEPTYLEGFHADIHVPDGTELTLPDWITRHFPDNPVHSFGG